MPLFEFECVKCGCQFEELVLNADDEKDLVCPSCESANVRKLFSAFGFKSGSKRVSSVASSGDACGSCSTKTCSTCG